MTLQPSPCPFCGGINLVREGYHLCCWACGADGPDADTGDEESLIEAWNTRAALASQAQPDSVAALPVQEWQPIATAPKDGTEVLLARGSVVTFGAWSDEVEELSAEYHANGEYLGQFPNGIVHEAYWCSWDGGFTSENPPTAWMSLPPPPAAKD